MMLLEGIEQLHNSSRGDLLKDLFVGNVVRANWCPLLVRPLSLLPGQGLSCLNLDLLLLQLPLNLLVLCQNGGLVAQRREDVEYSCQ